MPKLSLNNLNVTYNESGSISNSNKILILHGWNQFGSQSWLEFLKLNSDKKYYIIALDLPCFGDSDCPDVVWDTFDYAKFCVQFIEEFEILNNLKPQKWNLIGHSFGGAISALISTKHPEKINSLSLVAPAIIRKKPTKKQILIRKITRILNFANNIPILKQLKPIATKIWYKIIGSPDYNLTTGVKRDIMVKILDQDLSTSLSQLKLKSLLIWGTDDSYTPFSDFETVEKLLKPTKTLIYKDFKHGIHIQDSGKLFTDITNFID